MISSETCIIVAIADLIIAEGLYFNIGQKPRFKKVLYLARKLSIGYQPPNRNIISKNIMDLIHDKNMERNFIFILEESDIFGYILSVWRLVTF